jgi:3',5'-cyclic AMP phosphodiesterase CpdA
MRRIVHISDLHFGRVDYAIVERLREKILEINPNLVIVSGDLTQRARSAQFIEARDFLEKLPKPQIVVPGNHDIPMHNVFARFFSPLDKYKQYITEDLEPFFADEEMAVIGINTARSLVIKDGRINDKQILQVRERMCALDDKMLKIVVTHHPFDLPAGFDEDDIVDNAEHAMPQIADCGADVFLSGHLHVSHVAHTAERYKLESGRNALVIQAGTATSTRGRGEANSFNLIEFEFPNLVVKRLECEQSEIGFREAQSEQFRQSEKGWVVK